jgi:hypothetical protein
LVFQEPVIKHGPSNSSCSGIVVCRAICFLARQITITFSRDVQHHGTAVHLLCLAIKELSAQVVHAAFVVLRRIGVMAGSTVKDVDASGNYSRFWTTLSKSSNDCDGQHDSWSSEEPNLPFCSRADKATLHANSCGPSAVMQSVGCMVTQLYAVPKSFMEIQKIQHVTLSNALLCELRSIDDCDCQFILTYRRTTA